MTGANDLLAYDPTSTYPSGYWSHSCGAQFYAGGEPLHNHGCPNRNATYDECTFHFGPSNVEAAKAAASESGDDTAIPRHLGGGRLNLEVLRENFPQLVG